ncbi:hypothetical protein AAFF_G00134350 [Aldrovandia affinis]|uniref:Ly6/PLAUR domain-containing protein 1-like n=1 Tax=Aldrovandia affinis TaxID=143900 RepID=A0AAD7WA27_9TELE|nr:hypothetical protein AAFF_G00134350 [Aldrovandia affinis]
MNRSEVPDNQLSSRGSFYTSVWCILTSKVPSTLSAGLAGKRTQHTACSPTSRSHGSYQGLCSPRKLARSDGSSPAHSGERMWLLIYTTFLGFFLKTGIALQIQCYQCEEVKHNDCSTPEFIVNCTVNVQDMCQKEVLVREDGVHYRKSCASSGACLIASSGYQQFCTGKLHSVCISCCNTPLSSSSRCSPFTHRRHATSDSSSVAFATETLHAENGAST